ncbi:MAG: hypothetical protein AAF517_11210 [Planctomycetota bacterium]
MSEILRRVLGRSAVALLALTICSCSEGDPQPAEIIEPGPNSAPLVLTAGSVRLPPDSGNAPAFDRARLGFEEVSGYYDLTTPAGEPFRFDIVTRNDGNRGTARVSIAHASVAGRTPDGDVETLAREGIVVATLGESTGRALWLESSGDGFARATLQGAIDREQVIAVEVFSEASEEPTCALVRLRPGPESEITVRRQNGLSLPFTVERATLYSSDSYFFGLPTIATNGDRTTIVTYEGDRADPHRFERYELRLQYAPDSREVTAGAAPEPSPDAGYWRDHEVAALFNVLALVSGGGGGVELKISFDRGATFSQTERFQSAQGFDRTRLVQIAMALDYSMAIIYWVSTDHLRRERSRRL